MRNCPSYLKETLQSILGASNVSFGGQSVDQYGVDFITLKGHILGVVKPSSTFEVQQIVRLANLHQISIFPIGTMNRGRLTWLLSKEAGTLILDLARMNRIHEIQEELEYAVIEPGVTQLQLYEFIRHANLRVIFNPRSTGVHTSILENVLERTAGFLGSDSKEISNLEVVLGNGEVIQTGLGNFDHALTKHLYPFGIGPDIQELFFQSNMGIVTKATLTLSPFQSQESIIVCRLKRGNNFEKFINELALLKKQNIFLSSFQLIHKRKVRAILTQKLASTLLRYEQLSINEAYLKAAETFNREIQHDWVVIGGVRGDSIIMNPRLKAVCRKMRKFGTVKLIAVKKLTLIKRFSKMLPYSRKIALKHAYLEFLETILNLIRGVPTTMSLRDQFPVGQDLEIPFGHWASLTLVFQLPIKGDAINEVECLMFEVFNKFNFEPEITFKMVMPKSLEGTIDILYNNFNTLETEKAYACIDELTRCFYHKGYISHKLGVSTRHTIMDNKNYYWEVLRLIKNTLDPNAVIAKGRYGF